MRAVEFHIRTGILFVFTLVLNQNHTVMAQQGPNGTSFQLGNMTFSHRLASVNGIQLHYVIGGHGPPVVLLHGWPETWYEFRLISQVSSALPLFANFV